MKGGEYLPLIAGVDLV